MENCKKCNEPFEIPEFAIEMVYATYCKKCINKALKKSLKQDKTPNQIISEQAKRLEL